MEIFKEDNGKYSSKRAMGILYMIIGLILAVDAQFSESREIESFEVWFTIVVTGGALIGVSLLKYLGKK